MEESKFIKECKQASYFNPIINLSSSDVDFDQLLDELQSFTCAFTYDCIKIFAIQRKLVCFILKIGLTSL